MPRNLPERIRLTQPVGSHNELDIVYIRGLHGVPNFEIWEGRKPSDFYWRANNPKAVSDFLFYKWIWGTNPDGTEYSYAESVDNSGDNPVNNECVSGEIPGELKQHVDFSPSSPRLSPPLFDLHNPTEP